jgi:hypothetical protein
MFFIDLNLKRSTIEKINLLIQFIIYYFQRIFKNVIYIDIQNKT